MTILNTVVRGWFGLLIDDRSLAFAILASLGLVALLMHEAVMHTAFAGLLLVGGTILISIENVMRIYRQSKAKQKLLITEV